MYADKGVNSYTGQLKGCGRRRGSDRTPVRRDVSDPDIFKNVSARFQALGIGHAQIDSYTYKDIRDKGRRSLPTKTSS